MSPDDVIGLIFLHRNGARPPLTRYPGLSIPKEIIQQNNNAYETGNSVQLVLTPLGEKQMINMGHFIRDRYDKIIDFTSAIAYTNPTARNCQSAKIFFSICTPDDNIKLTELTTDLHQIFSQKGDKNIESVRCEPFDSPFGGKTVGDFVNTLLDITHSSTGEIKEGFGILDALTTTKYHQWPIMDERLLKCADYTEQALLETTSKLAENLENEVMREFCLITTDFLQKLGDVGSCQLLTCSVYDVNLIAAEKVFGIRSRKKPLFGSGLLFEITRNSNVRIIHTMVDTRCNCFAFYGDFIREEKTTCEITLASFKEYLNKCVSSSENVVANEDS